MDGLLTYISGMLAAYWPWIAGAAAVLIALRLCLTLLIRWIYRWWSWEYKRSFLDPRSWFLIQPKHQFKAKAKLIAHEDIRAFYSPPDMRNSYTATIREGQGNWKLAWLSPFPKAVGAAIRETTNLQEGQKLRGVKFIREVARHITVRDLPRGIYTGGDPRKHFRIDFEAMGKDPEAIARLEGRISTQLQLNGGLEPYKSGEAHILSYIAHREKVIDPLTESPIGMEWLKENPAKSPMALPMAIRQDGKPWLFGLHHTLINGTSGSGKGSPLQTVIFQEAPFIMEGKTQLYGIDPKRSELKLYADYPTSLFKRISMGMSDEAMREHAETISILKAIVDRRSETSETSIEAGNVKDGRTFKATKERPLIIFLIDEFPTLMEGFNQLGRDGKKPLGELRQIISTGRSLGVYLITATQDSDQKTVDPVRKNISNWIVLRQGSKYMNDLFLYDGAAKDGFDSTAIPSSGEADGYRTAGIGYVRDEILGAVKIRFPFIGPEDIGALIRSFQEHDGEQQTASSTGSKSISRQEHEDEEVALEDFDLSDYETEW